MPESKQQHAGVGARIRRRRLELGLKQGALAAQLGISPAYLNLIEHDRRRIGGRLLNAAARALDIAPARLSQGAAGALVDGVRAAAGAAGRPELGERAEALAAAMPDWAALVTEQARRIAAQDRAIVTLSDRLTHDPFLSESMHEMLSSVASVRSTAGILREDDDLDPDWLHRFHRNLYEDSQRLAESAQALVEYLDAGASPERGLSTPQEEAEAWFAARGWHLPAVEDGADPAELLADDAPESAAGRAHLSALLRQYAADAAVLPLPRMRAALAEDGVDPLRLADRFNVDPIAVFRRLVMLPDDMLGPVGLVLCDASGTLTFRRPITGFDFPRYGAACALWPLYDALTRPMRPVSRVIARVGSLPRRFHAHALARPRHPQGFDGPEVVEAAMLLRDAPAGADADEAVGTSCRICARAECPARREPSILGAV